MLSHNGSFPGVVQFLVVLIEHFLPLRMEKMVARIRSVLSAEKTEAAGRK